MPPSCYTCRRRRVECDMSQPPCGKCTKAGLECFQKRPLRWVEGAAFRGKPKSISARINLVSSTVDESPLTISEGISIGTSNRAYATWIDNSDGNVDSPKWLSRGASMGMLRECHGAGPLDILSIPPGLDDPSIISLDKTSRYYLYYYSKCLCKLFIMYDTNKNPLRNLIPAALEEPVLLMSIVALSAQHMANTTRRFYSSEGECYGVESVDASHSALLYKYRAIQGLSRAVNDARSYRRDFTIASAFLLIFLDLLESGNDNWNFHLEGIKKLINCISHTDGSQTTAQQGLGATIQGLRDFIVRQIYLIDTLGATCTRPRLLSRSTLSRSITSLQMSVDKAYLGCPDDLLDALRSFSISRDAMTSPEHLEDAEVYSRIQRVVTVLGSTRSFDCNAWAAGLSHPDPSSIPSTMLGKLAQSYKLGTLIYGTRVLDALTGSNTSLSNSLGELIDTIDALKSDEALFKCILWPMFVAGLESREGAQRQYVIECLEKFWFETKCINVVNAANLLRHFWKQEECSTMCSQWIFNIGQMEGDWLLI
ncbi:hypothetical protein BO94DRAFT_558693 [Aspergillus sclerotioniger CBS 115572]|uniref:Zn(2)-C6 fungal-type domain-containing protein n=1 Tax=Aspergillus sclerotioniger CBS 115572 TaxID=1450535 RepID=A0A317VYS9_9EURO|nr:hypothetical protein BO94DRAFT_558693 [Aspergillus sclerotioniger CBS 115572]PWY79514.1 hypothetical protein BO94DRAFT_558693 [Aspergillus sclerotioniger CBS 115572]